MMSPEAFARFWLDGHGHRAVALPGDEVECRRIEWRYLDEEVGRG